MLRRQQDTRHEFKTDAPVWWATGKWWNALQIDSEMNIYDKCIQCEKDGNVGIAYVNAEAVQWKGRPCSFFQRSKYHKAEVVQLSQ